MVDNLARVLAKVEELGIWPEGLLDAYIAMIPKVDGDATPLGQRPLSVLPVVYRVWASARMVHLELWFRSWVPSCVFSAGGGRSSVQAWFTTALDIEEVLSGIVEGDIHIFVADVIKSFDTVDRAILDRVLSSLGLPGWFRHAYFEFHSLVRLRFKLAAGLGQPWTRDGGIPQGCPLSMMFIVALYLLWCRYLASHEGVQPQLYADNLKCVSRDPGVLLRAARFTTGYVRLVGQEPAPRKCVFLSTSRVVREDMRGWVVTDQGDRWTVELDVRDLGGHLDTTFRGWSSTFATRVRVAIARLVVVFALPLHFHGRLGILRSMFIPGALHGIEASFLAESSVRKLRSALGLLGLDVSLLLMWVQFSVCWMVLLVVTLLFVSYGFVFVRCVGTWLSGLRRFIGFIDCSLLLLRGPLVMGLRICFLRVLLRLGSLGALVILGGIGRVYLYWSMVQFSIFGLPFLCLET